MTDAVIQKILRSFPIFANSVTCEKNPRISLKLRVLMNDCSAYIIFYALSKFDESGNLWYVHVPVVFAWVHDLTTHKHET